MAGPLVEYQKNLVYEANNQNENAEYSMIDNDENQYSNRKRRHTPSQVQVMEAFFKDCPRPNENQRISLSQELGLDSLQVKCWFQNKRSQLKNQQKRSESSILKDENEKLRAENKKLKEVASKISCMRCGKPNALEKISSSPLDQLKYENVRLKNELESVHNLTKNYLETSSWNDPQLSVPSVTPRSLDLGVGIGSYGGQQLLINSGEQTNYVATRKFNVPCFVPQYDGQRMFYQTTGVHVWPQQSLVGTSRKISQDTISPLMD